MRLARDFLFVDLETKFTNFQISSRKFSTWLYKQIKLFNNSTW